MLSRPSKEELAERQRVNDSIALVRQMEYEAQRISEAISAEQATRAGGVQAETSAPSAEQISATYGAFAPSAQGENREVVLENSKMRLHINTKGGNIGRAELKEYKAYALSARRTKNGLWSV